MISRYYVQSDACISILIMSDNVDASNAAHTNQKATGTCTETITTAVTSQVAIESQLRVLMGNYIDLCNCYLEEADSHISVLANYSSSQ